MTVVWCAVHVGKNEYQVDFLYRDEKGIQNTQFDVKVNFGRHRKAATAMALLMTQKSPLEYHRRHHDFGISWIGWENGLHPVIRHPDIYLIADRIVGNHVFYRDRVRLWKEGAVPSSRFRLETLIRENLYIGEFTDYSKNQLGGCADDEFFETIESFVPFTSYRANMIEKG